MSIESNKMFSYIGFAVKSGKVIFGLDMLLRAKRKPNIIIIDANLGQNSLKQVKLYSERNTVEIIAMTEGLLASNLKRENVKIISILDESLASAIINEKNN